MGKIFVFVGSSWNFVPGYIKKRWHTLWKFQLEIRSNKKVIAKKSLTNLYEMNSSSKVLEGSQWNFRNMITFKWTCATFTFCSSQVGHFKVMALGICKHWPKCLWRELKFYGFKGVSMKIHIHVHHQVFVCLC